MEHRLVLIFSGTPDQVGAYRFRIRHPVIASGAKQSRAVCAHSGLLRSARNDEVRRLTDAKGIIADQVRGDDDWMAARSEEHTSELQSLMRISYAVFCLQKQKNTNCNNKKRN